MDAFLAKAALYLQIGSALWSLVFGSKTLLDLRRFTTERKSRDQGSTPEEPKGEVPRAREARRVRRMDLSFVGGGVLAFLGATALYILVTLPTVPPSAFVVTSLQNGQVITNQTFPLTIKGTYSSEGSGRVWVVLQDSIGQYYLQYPPVHFEGNGQWDATNVRPFQGITLVDFIQVNSDGNDTFQQKVARSDFSAFPTVPDGSRLLLSISITSQVSTPTPS